MSESTLPPGWDEKRAASEQAGKAVVTVPEDLLPAIRRLLATHKTA